MKTFILFLFIPTICFSQNFKLGFKVESLAIYEEKLRGAEYNKEFDFYLPQSFNIQIGYNLPNVDLEIRPGFLSASDFEGFNLGFYANPQIFVDKLYGIFGIKFLFNNNREVGTGIVDVIESKTLSFFVIGAGYYLAKIISLEISYLHPFAKEIGYTSVSSSGIYVKNIHSIIKVGFGVNVDI
jgi:hypothetical protein